MTGCHGKKGGALAAPRNLPRYKMFCIEGLGFGPELVSDSFAVFPRLLA